MPEFGACALIAAASKPGAGGWPKTVMPVETPATTIQMGNNRMLTFPPGVSSENLLSNQSNCTMYRCPGRGDARQRSIEYYCRFAQACGNQVDPVAIDGDERTLQWESGMRPGSCRLPRMRRRSGRERGQLLRSAASYFSLAASASSAACLPRQDQKSQSSMRALVVSRDFLAVFGVFFDIGFRV